MQGFVKMAHHSQCYFLYIWSGCEWDM